MTATTSLRSSKAFSAPKSSRVEGAPETWAALTDYREQAAHFADCLIGKSNRGQGCEATATIDKAAALLSEFELT